VGKTANSRPANTPACQCVASICSYPVLMEIATNNPVLAALGQVSSAAFIGASVGRFIDMSRDRETTSGSTAGALIGVVIGALIQLRRLHASRVAN
jgi:hypothetical protein